MFTLLHILIYNMSILITSLRNGAFFMGVRVKPDYVFNGLINVPDIEIKYRGYTIKPKTDFSHPYKSINTYYKGYIVVRDGLNVLPGATWCASVIEAKDAIDRLIRCNGSADRYFKMGMDSIGLDKYTEV